MRKDKFDIAVELNEKIKYYQNHKDELINSNMQFGGGLIFTYNDSHRDVRLKNEIFGDGFFQHYMEALNNKIETLQKEFDEL